MKCSNPDCTRGIGLVALSAWLVHRAALLFEELPRCLRGRSPETATRAGCHDIFRVAFLRSIENPELKINARQPPTHRLRFGIERTQFLRVCDAA